MKNIKYEKFKELVRLIYEYGENYPKKHGNWIKLRYLNHKDYWFIMDSWNKSIHLVEGAEYDNQYTGFKIKGEINYIGIDFGRFELKISEELLDFYLENLRYELEERNA
jgi:hypothetical protein